jgi:uncharacterized protein YdeI (BOF family)
MSFQTKLLFGLITLSLSGFILYGMLSYTDQAKNTDSVTYGRVEEGSKGSATVPIAELLAGKSVSNVTIEGKVVNMGPTMGCWLVINDGTGEILVQTDQMVYMDQGVKGKTIRATGSLTILNGGMGFSGETLALLTSGISIDQENAK